MRAFGIYLVGWLALIFGLIGLVLPVIPGVALLIIAAGCFAKTSGRMYAAMLRIPVVGGHVRAYHDSGGLAPEVKTFSVLAVMGSVAWALGFVVKEGLLRVFVLVLGLAVILRILLIPTTPRQRERFVRMLPAPVRRG